MKKLCTNCAYLDDRQCVRPDRTTGLPLIGQPAKLERWFYNIFGCWFTGRFFKQAPEATKQPGQPIGMATSSVWRMSFCTDGVQTVFEAPFDVEKVEATTDIIHVIEKRKITFHVPPPEGTIVNLLSREHQL
jgi:hypothetical protein